MPLDPHAKRFLDRLAALNPPSPLALSVAARREALDSLLSLSAGTAPEASIEERTIAGPAGALPLRLYAPPAPLAARSAALLYFHGGGLVAGGLDSHDGIARELAQACGCRLISVGYRLAPEAPFPAAVEDACAAAAWVAAHTQELAIDPAQLGVCGDSAGATLAAVVCQQALRTGGPHFALQFLLCPILDLAEESPSRRALGADFLVGTATLEHDRRHYLGEADVRDPRVSPLLADLAALHGLPPACIHTAEFDPLRDEGQRYAQRLQEAGVSTLYRCHLGMIHLFYGMGAVIPHAAAAYREIGADIRSMLQGSWRPG